MNTATSKRMDHSTRPQTERINSREKTVSIFEAHIFVVDRILERWAVSVAGGFNEDWEVNRRSKAPPLPDDLAIEVDSDILHMPEPFPALLKGWYRKDYPVEAIANQLGCSRTEVYPRLRMALWYLYGRWMVTGTVAKFVARTRPAPASQQKPAQEACKSV
jgi:hypothetical protein